MKWLRAIGIVLIVIGASVAIYFLLKWFDQILFWIGIGGGGGALG